MNNYSNILLDAIDWVCLFLLLMAIYLPYYVYRAAPHNLFQKSLVIYMLHAYAWALALYNGLCSDTVKQQLFFLSISFLLGAILPYHASVLIRILKRIRLRQPLLGLGHYALGIGEIIGAIVAFLLAICVISNIYFFHHTKLFLGYYHLWMVGVWGYLSIYLIFKERSQTTFIKHELLVFIIAALYFMFFELWSVIYDLTDRTWHLQMPFFTAMVLCYGLWSIVGKVNKSLELKTVFWRVLLGIIVLGVGWCVYMGSYYIFDLFVPKRAQFLVDLFSLSLVLAVGHFLVPIARRLIRVEGHRDEIIQKLRDRMLKIQNLNEAKNTVKTLVGEWCGAGEVVIMMCFQNGTWESYNPPIRVPRGDKNYVVLEGICSGASLERNTYFYDILGYNEGAIAEWMKGNDWVLATGYQSDRMKAIVAVAGPSKGRNYTYSFVREMPEVSESIFLMLEIGCILDRACEQERFASQGRIIPIMAHEFRQPLAAIELAFRTLMKTYDVQVPEDKRSGKERMSRDSIYTELLRLNQLTSSLLASRKTELEGILEEVDLVGTIRKMMPTLFVMAPSRGIMIIPSLPDSSLWVKGDVGYITQIVMNLMVNAKDAVLSKIAPGPSEISIIVDEDIESNSAYLQIEDNGDGIPESLRDRLFNAFETTKGASGGMGLGLYIVKNMVDQMKATIELHVDYGEDKHGTKFRVSWPLVRKVSNPEPARPSTKQISEMKNP